MSTTTLQAVRPSEPAESNQRGRYDKYSEVKRIAGLRPVESRLGRSLRGEVRCPFHEDSNPSFGTFTFKSTGLPGFKCQAGSCGWTGDVIGFVQKFDQVSFAEAVSRIRTECGIPEERLEVFKYDDIAAREAFKKAIDFLVARDIDPDTARLEGVGYIDHPRFGPTITLPYGDGKTVKFRPIQRHDNGPKYTHLAGGRNDRLYAADEIIFRVDEDWFITESELDCLRLRSYGYNAVSVCSASVAANREGVLTVDPRDIQRLNENAGRIFLALDMDAAGQRCADAFEKALLPYKTFRLSWRYRGKESGDPKDIGEFPREGFKERIESLVTAAVGSKKRIVYSYSDLPTAYDLTLNAKEVDWLVRDIVPLNDKSILCGFWGNYKSYLALSLAKAVATGTKFVGMYETRQRPVIYLDKENSRNEIGRRASLLRIPQGAEVRVWCEKNIPFPKIDDPRLISFAEQLKPLIIVDTLVGFSDAEDENQAREMRTELERYLELISRGATVLALHHPPKNRAETSETNWFRGSGDIGAFFAMGLYVHCTNPENGTVEFSTPKSRPGPKTKFTVQAFPYIDETGDFRVIDGQEADDPSKIAQLIAESPGVSQRVILANCGISEWPARRLLDKHNGKLWRTEGGRGHKRYFPVNGD